MQQQMILMLQQQLLQARENQTNLRRINDSLVLALEAQNNIIDEETKQEIERRIVEKYQEKIKQIQRMYQKKLEEERKKRKQTQKSLELEHIKSERRRSESQNNNLAKLRDNKMKHIQGLMQQIIQDKLPTSRSNSNTKALNSHRKSVAAQNICPSDFLSTKNSKKSLFGEQHEAQKLRNTYSKTLRQRLNMINNQRTQF